MTRGRYAVLAGLLGLLPMLLPMSLDGSLPVMPALAAHFRTTVGAVQFSFSAMVLGIALGQLVYGPLSDRFGRKPVIVAGVLLYVAASLSCTLAGSIETLIWLRFLQGFFGCSGIIVARAVIRDMFDREAGARLFALMMGIHGIMPAVAPGVGGLLTEAYGWRAVFYAMTGFGACTALAIAIGLTESHRSRRPDATRLRGIALSYREILRDRTFRSYAGCACFMYSALLAYFAGAPVGLIQYLGLTPATFGVAMAMPMVAYILAQLAVARLAPRVGINGMIRAGTILAAAAGIGMLVFVLSDNVSVYTLIGPVILVLVSMAFITPSTTAGAMSPFPHMAGAASSLLGFIQFAAGAAAATVVGLLNDGTPLPMAAVICGCTAGALVAWRVLVRPLHRERPA